MFINKVEQIRQALTNYSIENEMYNLCGEIPRPIEKENLKEYNTLVFEITLKDYEDNSINAFCEEFVKNQNQILAIRNKAKETYIHKHYRWATKYPDRIKTSLCNYCVEIKEDCSGDVYKFIIFEKQ